MRCSASSSFATASRLERWLVVLVGGLGVACLVGAIDVLASGCAVEAKTGPPNVILVCIDTLRADHLGCYGHTRATSPYLDALAARSTLFEDASAAACWTKPSVPSFLTGTYPNQHGVYEGSARGIEGASTDVLPEGATTLAEVFREHGYGTGAVVMNAQLKRGNGFEQGFEDYLDQAGDARSIRWQALDWIDGQSGEQPFFLYLHFLDAHWPYDVPEDHASLFASAVETARFRGGDSRALRDAINDGEMPFDARDRAALEALYDGAIRHVDDELARLAQALARRGLDENTVICVISDHGEEFGEHEKIGHGHGLYENLLAVPWILHVPGREPGRVATPVSLVDLFPTLLGAAHLRAPATHSGVDRCAEPDAVRSIFAEHKAPDRYEQSLRASATKLVRSFEPPASRLDAGACPVVPGTRWEAEFRCELDGTRTATQLEPREEPLEEPLELKGPIEGLASDRFTLGGIEVRFEAGTPRSLSEGETDDSLAEGRLVKARGRFEQGVLVADKLKLYGSDADAALEIRGCVEAVALIGSAGSLTIAGLELRVDEHTDVEAANAVAKRMTREQIAELLELGGAGAEEAGFSRDVRAFDLTRDAGEIAPSAARDPAIERELDALGKHLAGRGFWSDADRKTLGTEALGELKDIGYAR